MAVVRPPMSTFTQRPHSGQPLSVSFGRFLAPVAVFVEKHLNVIRKTSLTNKSSIKTHRQDNPSISATMSNNIGGYSGRYQQTNGTAPESQTDDPQVLSNHNTGPPTYPMDDLQAYLADSMFDNQCVSSPTSTDNGQQPSMYFDGFEPCQNFDDAGVPDTYDCQQTGRRSSSPLPDSPIAKLSGGRRFSSLAGDTSRNQSSDSVGSEQSDGPRYLSAQRRDTTRSEESYSSASSSPSNTAVCSKTRAPQYTCPTCNTPFTLRRNGERHKRAICDRIAEGLAPGAYECKHPDCGKRFTRNEHMKAHMKKVHQK